MAEIVCREKIRKIAAAFVKPIEPMPELLASIASRQGKFGCIGVGKECHEFLETNRLRAIFPCPGKFLKIFPESVELKDEGAGVCAVTQKKGEC